MMTCAREVPGSNLERDPICSEGFRRFAQFIPTGAHIMPYIRTGPYSLPSFAFDHSAPCMYVQCKVADSVLIYFCVSYK